MFNKKILKIPPPLKKMHNKLGLSSAKLSRAKFGYLEVIFEVVSKDNLKQSEHCLELLFETPKNMLL